MKRSRKKKKVVKNKKAKGKMKDAKDSRLGSDMKDIKVELSTYKKIILFSKISAVFIFAIGLELITHDNVPLALILMVIAVIIIILPIRVTVKEGDGGA